MHALDVVLVSLHAPHDHEYDDAVDTDTDSLVPRPSRGRADDTWQRQARRARHEPKWAKQPPPQAAPKQEQAHQLTANAACCKVPGTSFRANQVEPREPNKLKSQKPKQHLHS